MNVRNNRQIAAKKIAIAGFGREGKSLLRFLKSSPEYEGSEIWILDKDPELNLPRGTHKRLGPDYLSDLGIFDIVFRSPSIPYECAEFRAARKRGVAFSSATKLFFESAISRVRTIVGITGTKGKSTTSTLLYTMLRKSKMPAMLAGNIGKPMLDLLPKLTPQSLVILELSSFQLQDLAVSPHIAAVLDIFPDHQNTHRTLAEYYGAKSNIARFQKSGDRVFFFERNTMSKKIGGMGKGEHAAISGEGFSLFGERELKMKGGHNFLNAVMAATVARVLGAPEEAVRKTAISFRGLPHRLEFVRALRARHRAIAVWNDSASSNPGSAAAAVRAFHGEEFILIAGGKDKNLDYHPLRAALAESPARLAVLYGENKKKIAAALDGIAIPIHIAKNLADATDYAVAFAKRMPARNATAAIVLSPGSASFDMFKNFEDRGEAFKKIVRSLA